MKILIQKILAPLVLSIALAAATVVAAQAECYDKRQIQDMVSSGQIMSLDAVLGSAGVDGSAEILSVQVCDQGGGLVYIIGVLSPDGEAQNLVLNAQ